LSDAEIIKGFLQGNRVALTTIQDWIRAVTFSRNWTGDLSAEDIVSETTEKLLHAFREEKFRYESSLKTYVQRIARYTIVDSVRDGVRAREYAKRAAGDPTLFPPEDDPFESDEQVVIFHEVMRRAGEDCKRLWNMIFQKIPYAKIAEQMGTSVGAIKTRVMRCRQKATEIGKKLM
jgi:RNA polymerase sigma factor (sigma-70 family)